MNFLELCRRLRQETGGVGSGPSTTVGQSGESARLANWVRTAWQEIQTEQLWLFDWAQGEVALTTQDTQYALPNDFDVWEADTLRFGSDPIPVVPWSELGAAGPLSQVAIAPDGTLHLNGPPKEAGALSFEYWRTPQILAVDTDVPRMPERFHLAIVYRAHKQYGFYESAPEAIQMAATNEAGIMHTLLQSQTPPVVQAGPLA